MAARKLVIFRHACALGNAPAQDLFGRLKTWRAFKGEHRAIGASETDNWPAARAFTDDAIPVDRAGLSDSVEIIERD
jgi:CRISPR-associated protein Csd2